MSGEPANKGASQREASSSADPTKNARGPSPPRASRSTSAIPQLARSRKSSQEFSPTRNNALSSNLSTIPSAAALQRALSAQRPINPPSSVDGVLESSRQDRPFHSGQNSPAWPTSPRLRSPPPASVGARLTPSRKMDTEPTPSNTSLKRQFTASGSDMAAGTKMADLNTHSGLRVPTRGASTQSGGLEPVAEGSAPATPFIGPLPSSDPDVKIDATSLNGGENTEAPLTKDSDGSGEGETKHSIPNGDGGKKLRASSLSQPGMSLAKRSLTSLTASKPKPPDPPRTMTIETEPVISMPQLIVGERGMSARDGNGSVRTKPSNETIRPKKEKKKATRKPTSLHSGTVTSKADLFEAKVASAVDEADTSDSDETFVYESNPPDNRGNRHHSRTPSANSLAGQDQYGRNRHGIRSGSHVVGVKKSMKFSNSAYNNHLDDEAGEGRGSVRNTTPRPHHIGRYGKNPHQSILDANSPFTQVNKPNSPRTATGTAARTSRPNSPRLANGRISSSLKKANGFEVYDDVADDERTPLMESVRVNRTRHNRRPYSSELRHSDYFDETDRSSCAGWGGCMLLGLVVLVACVGVAVFVVGLNQPLLGVKARHLQNILASEQELMLDLHVDAVNSNVFAITVNDLDVNVFAQSAYVGTTREWEKQHKQLRWGRRAADDEMEPSSWPWPPYDTDDDVDEGTDPIDDPEQGTQKMLLGRVLEFDSPLVFEASPLQRARSSSVGEIRLARPGNKTEAGGSARWERVLQHPFDLIVRGVIKYQLPLSSKTRSVKISSCTKIYPDDDDDDDDESAPGNSTSVML